MVRSFCSLWIITRLKGRNTLAVYYSDYFMRLVSIGMDGARLRV